MTPTGGGRPRTAVPATALATALRREADPAAVQARTGAEQWARACIGQQCGLRILRVETGDLSPTDRQDFTRFFSTGWQVMTLPGVTPDTAAAQAMAVAMLRPCLDLSGGRAAMLRALGECALLVKVPGRVQADPVPVLRAYAGAMAGYPVMACECAIRSWPDAHDFWPAWPELRRAIHERAGVLSEMAAALTRWIEQEGVRAAG